LHDALGNGGPTHALLESTTQGREVKPHLARYGAVRDLS
jgi:hypothetical protein